MDSMCQVRWLGRMDYGQTLELQKDLAAKRLANQIPDTMLLLEHPQTYTVGVDGYQRHLLISKAEMAGHNIAYYQKVDRGGGIFFRCPGQLVVYPILKLGENCRNYHDYIDKLERVIIHTLSYFKIRAFRQQGQGTIWVFSADPAHTGQLQQADDAVAKIGGIGIKVDRQGITSHGFWINVNPNLQYFDLIVPGAIKDRYVTSMQHILNKPIEIGAIIQPVIESFSKIFEVEPLCLETPVAAKRSATRRISAVEMNR